MLTLIGQKTFGYGFMDGLSGAVTKPYKGAKEGGWIGFSKGLAKGAAGLFAGPGAGMNISFDAFIILQLP